MYNMPNGSVIMGVHFLNGDGLPVSSIPMQKDEQQDYTLAFNVTHAVKSYLFIYWLLYVTDDDI